MYIDKDLCDVCGTCAAVCPSAAITIREFEAVINDDKCIRCEKCVRVCPAQAVSIDNAQLTIDTDNVKSDDQTNNSADKKSRNISKSKSTNSAMSIVNCPLSIFDVVVVGAGPAGSVTARFIAEAGLSVLLLERDREPGIPVRCAEGVSVNGISHFIDPDPRWICAEIEGARLHSPDGESVEMYNNGNGYVLDRRIFDRALADLAVSKGAILKTKADAIGLLYDSYHRITGVRYRHEKQIIDVHCKIVIGADGVESQVGRWAGFDTCLSLSDIDTCCQYTVNNIEIPMHLCQFYFGKDVAPGGYLWIFPKSPTQANIGIGIGGDDATAGKGPKYYLDKFMDTHFPDASVNYIVYGGVPTRAGNDFVRDNVMLVGDAAHQVNPITGGGIVQGMIAGKYCGETAVKAIKAGDTSAKFLKQYNKRWDEHLGANQRFMYDLKHKFMGMNDKIFNTLVATCKKIPKDELNLQRLFKETIKEDPILLARLATSFVVSKMK